MWGTVECVTDVKYGKKIKGACEALLSVSLMWKQEMIWIKNKYIAWGARKC